MSTGNGPGTRTDYSMQLHNFFQKEVNRGNGGRLAFSEQGIGPAHDPAWTINVHSSSSFTSITYSGAHSF